MLVLVEGSDWSPNTSDGCESRDFCFVSKKSLFSKRICSSVLELLGKNSNKERDDSRSNSLFSWFSVFNLLV